MVCPILISVAVTPGVPESPPPLSAGGPPFSAVGADVVDSPPPFFLSQPAASRMRQTPVNAASRGAVGTTNQFCFDMYPPLVTPARARSSPGFGVAAGDPDLDRP